MLFIGYFPAHRLCTPRLSDEASSFGPFLNNVILWRALYKSYWNPTIGPFAITFVVYHRTHSWRKCVCFARPWSVLIQSLIQSIDSARHLSSIILISPTGRLKNGHFSVSLFSNPQSTFSLNRLRASHRRCCCTQPLVSQWAYPLHSAMHMLMHELNSLNTFICRRSRKATFTA